MKIVTQYGRDSFDRERASSFFGELALISGGVYGNAYYSDRGCILKFPTNSKHDGGCTLVHEAFVGIKACNFFREMGILNFGYVYTFGRGCPPIFCETHLRGNYDVLSFYDSGNSPFCVYEYIPGDILGKKIPSLRNSDAKEILLGCSLALLSAAKMKGFTHYDFTTSNIILRPIPAPMEVEYPLNEERTEIRKMTFSNYIPTIFDYGLSFFEDEGKGYGFPCYETLEGYGIMYFPNPLTDIYKLICYIGYSSYPTNANLFSLLRRVITFFNNEESFEDILRLQKERSYFYPPSDTKTLEGFILFLELILEESIEIVISSTPIPPLQLSISQIEKEIPPFVHDVSALERLDRMSFFPLVKFTKQILFSSPLYVGGWLNVALKKLRAHYFLRKNEEVFEKIISVLKILKEEIYTKERELLSDRNIKECIKDFRWHRKDLPSILYLIK